MPKNRLLSKFLRENSSREGAEKAKRFFKTEPGAYAAHDKFLGIPTPLLRKATKQFADLSSAQIRAHLRSPFNEERLLALLILVGQYVKNKDPSLVALYLEELSQVNNWNLVDSSAYFLLSDVSLLKKLARSENLWERRVAIVATWGFIRKGEMQPTIAIAKMLLKDKEDLIHKAVGWMLREMGKRNEDLLLAFLKEHEAKMARTTYRYATERCFSAK